MEDRLGPCTWCDKPATFMSVEGIPLCNFVCLLRHHADYEQVSVRELVGHVLLRSVLLIAIIVGAVMILHKLVSLGMAHFGWG